MDLAALIFGNEAPPHRMHADLSVSERDRRHGVRQGDIVARLRPIWGFEGNAEGPGNRRQGGVGLVERVADGTWSRLHAPSAPVEGSSEDRLRAGRRIPDPSYRARRASCRERSVWTRRGRRIACRAAQVRSRSHGRRSRTTQPAGPRRARRFHPAPSRPRGRRRHPLRSGARAANARRRRSGESPSAGS